MQNLILLHYYTKGNIMTINYDANALDLVAKIL